MSKLGGWWGLGTGGWFEVHWGVSLVPGVLRAVCWLSLLSSCALYDLVPTTHDLMT